MNKKLIPLNIKILTILLLLNVAFITNAQLDEISNYGNRIESLSIENGLSHNNVKCIAQDENGFIWIGTLDGLNRYDGYQFESYFYEIDDTTSLRNNFIQDICFDQQGKAWISTWGGGINNFDSKTQKISCFSKLINKKSHYIHDHISFIRFTSSGTHWIGTLDGLVKYNPKNDDYIIYRHSDSNPNSISMNYLTKGIITHNGEILIIDDQGVLNLHNPVQNNFTRIKLLNQANELIPISCFFESSDGKIFVGSSKGLYQFDALSHQFSNSFLKNSCDLSKYEITYITEFSPGVFWLGTKKHGIIELKKIDEVTGSYQINCRQPLFDGTWITYIFKDKQENIWVGTEHEGLKVIFNKKKKFHFIDKKLNPVSAIIKNKDHLWLGTSNGLFNYNMSTQKLIEYNLENGLSSNNIRSLYLDSDKLLIGTEKGLNTLDLQTKKITILRDDKDILNYPIVAITKDKKGNYWMGSDRKGLICMNETSENIENYITQSMNSLIGNYNVTSIGFDTEGMLWVGIYGGGINKFDPEERKFTKRYLSDPKKTNHLIDNNIMHFYIDYDVIWLASQYGGIIKFNRIEETFKNFLKKDGLPSNNVNSAIKDNLGNMWFGTTNGLVKMNIETENIKHYDQTDGLLSNLFVAKANYKDQNGMLYFGSNAGVNFFLPYEIGENPEVPDLVLSDLKIFNKPVEIGSENSILKKHISYTDSIVLKYDQTAISIEYVALNYISSSKNRYAYKMEGIENEWRMVGDQRVANYSNLPPGEYIFHVKASNNDDIWTTAPRSLYIKVLPPPWRSTTAYIIYAIVFVLINLLFMGFVLWYNKRQHDLKLAIIERDKEKQVSHFKLQFFTNISHELRTHLTMIIYPINKLLKRSNQTIEFKSELERINLNARRLLKLTDEIIDFRKVEQGKIKLELQETNIVQFLSEIEALFRPLAEEHQLKFEFHCEQDSINWNIDKEKLTKVIFNLLTNAFKYTPSNEKINLYAQVNGDISPKLRIGVTDNGLGIDEEALPHVFDRFFNPGKIEKLHQEQDSSGIGLALAQQLIKLHGGEIFVESQKGYGSHFYFEIENTPIYDVPINVNLIDKTIKLDEKWDEMINIERNNVQVLAHENATIKSEKKYTILVVDDNKEICYAISEILESNYLIRIAYNGKQALENIEKHNIDLIISDIMMPVLDGITLCNEIKNNIHTSHIPLVLVTAKTGLENELIGLRTGADGYINKPFNEEKLLLTVKNILDSRNKLHELFSKENNQIEVKELDLNPIDKRLIEKIETLIKTNIADPDFGVDKLGKEVGLSRGHLYRKMKALTDMTPSDLIKKYRLELSKQLILEGNASITEIAYDSGFSTPGNFSSTFKKYYGKSPLQFKSECFKS